MYCEIFNFLIFDAKGFAAKVAAVAAVVSCCVCIRHINYWSLFNGKRFFKGII
jgi:hypothetical protein